MSIVCKEILLTDKNSIFPSVNLYLYIQSSSRIIICTYVCLYSYTHSYKTVRPIRIQYLCPYPKYVYTHVPFGYTRTRTPVCVYGLLSMRLYIFTSIAFMWCVRVCVCTDMKPIQEKSENCSWNESISDTMCAFSSFRQVQHFIPLL